MEFVTATLTGIALVKKSVDFIKENINTVNDLKGIAHQIDGFFEGEAQMNKKQGKGIGLAEQFGIESKPSKDHINEEAIDDQSGSFDNIKPSRTQRAINAKSNRLNDNKVQDTSGDQKASKENYTSDGIEALKPFESSLNGEKTQSS